MCIEKSPCPVVNSLHCLIHGAVQPLLCRIELIRLSSSEDGFISFFCVDCAQVRSQTLPDPILALIDAEQSAYREIARFIDGLDRGDSDYARSGLAEPLELLSLGCLHCHLEAMYDVLTVELEYVEYPADTVPSVANGFAVLSGYGQHWLGFRCLHCGERNHRLARRPHIHPLGGPLGPDRCLAVKPVDPALSGSAAADYVRELTASGPSEDAGA